MVETASRESAAILTNDGRWSGLLAGLLEEGVTVSRALAVKQVESMMVTMPPEAAFVHELVQVLKQKNPRKSYIACSIIDRILDTRVPVLRHHETLQSALQLCLAIPCLSATAIQTICQMTAFCALNGERVHVQMVPKIIAKIITVVEQHKGDQNVQMAFLAGVCRLMTVESIPWRNQTKLKQLVWSLCFHESDSIASPAMMALCKLTWLVTPDDKALVDEIVENSCAELDSLDVTEWSHQAVRHLQLLRHLLNFGGSSVKHMGDWKNTATKMDCVVKFPSKIFDVVRKLARHALYPSENRDVHLRIFAESLRLWCAVMETLGRGSVLMFNQRSFIRDLFSAPNDAVCLPEWVDAIDCVLVVAPGFFADKSLVHLAMRCFIAHMERAEMVSFKNVLRVLSKLLEQVGVLVKAEDATAMVEALSRLVWVGVHRPDAPGTAICQDGDAAVAIFDVLAAMRLAIPLQGRHIIFVLLNLLSRTTRRHDLKQRANKIWRQFQTAKDSAASTSVKVAQDVFTHSVSLVEPPAKKQRTEQFVASTPAPTTAAPIVPAAAPKETVSNVPAQEAPLQVPEPQVVEAPEPKVVVQPEPEVAASATPVEPAATVSTPAQTAPDVPAQEAALQVSEPKVVEAPEPQVVEAPEPQVVEAPEVSAAPSVAADSAKPISEAVPDSVAEEGVVSDDDISLDLASPDQSDEE